MAAAAPAAAQRRRPAVGARRPMAAGVALLLALAAPAAAWPAYKPPGPGDSRGPCPALNTLANHGYLNRNGRDVSIASIVKATKEVFNMEPAGMASVAGAVVAFDRLPSHALLFQVPEASRVQSSAGPTAFAELGELFAPGRTYFDASYTRDDSAPSQPQPRLPNRARINITLSFAEQAGGYLTPDACARARPVLYNLSRSTNPRFSWPALAPVAHVADCALTLAVFGDGARTRADVVRSFWADERLPEGWTPRKTPVTILELLALMTKIQPLVNAQPGCAQGC